MNRLYMLATAIVLICCQQSSKEEKIIDEPKIEASKPKEIENEIAIGEKIEGDFDKDDKKDFAIAVKTKEGIGNPVEDGTPAEYEIQFSNRLKPISAGCCDIIFINEGDINNDGVDDISVFQAPGNGCVYSMTTYSYTNGNWQKIVPTFLIPTGCESISEDELQKRVFKEGNSIYFYESDLNDENEGLVKRKVSIKN